MGMVQTWDLVATSMSRDGVYYEGKFSDGNQLDLGHPEIWGWTTADEPECEKAMQILDDLWMDKKLGTSGRRNQDAVNMCIALHVLGCGDIDAWLGWMQDIHVISSHDLELFTEHIERVVGYLDSWGPTGDKGAALGFVLY